MQIGEQRSQKEAQKCERVREGEMMKELALAEIEAEKQSRADHLERAAQSRAEFVEANVFLMSKKREEEQLIEALADQAWLDPCHQTNPVPVTREDLKELFPKAL